MSTRDDQAPIAANLRKLAFWNRVCIALAVASLGILVATCLWLYHFPGVNKFTQ